MKHCLVILLLITGLLARAELPFKLPPKAKYTASAEDIAAAKTALSTQLKPDAAALTNLFSAPMICGPGLWDALKGSPHFAKPPLAKTTVRVPVGKKFQELPAALLQDEEEVASFRKALAELLKSQGTLTVREPTREEFMIFWATTPSDTIAAPLLVAEGKEVAIFCQFRKEKEQIFWADEVKRMQFKKS
jgi:hypothetical protein